MFPGYRVITEFVLGGLLVVSFHFGVCFLIGRKLIYFVLIWYEFHVTCAFAYISQISCNLLFRLIIFSQPSLMAGCSPRRASGLLPAQGGCEA